MTLRHAINANCRIEGMNAKFVENLETQQERYRDESSRIRELERTIPHTKNAERKQMMETRLKAAYKKRNLAE